MIICQRMRVISSPSISTMGFAILILSIIRILLVRVMLSARAAEGSAYALAIFCPLSAAFF